MPSTAHIGYRPTGHRRARRRGGLATSGCHPSRAIVPPQWNRDSCKAETYGSYTWGDMKKADRYSTHVSTHTPDIPGDAASRGAIAIAALLCRCSCAVSSGEARTGAKWESNRRASERSSFVVGARSSSYQARCRQSVPAAPAPSTAATCAPGSPRTARATP